VIVEAGFHQEGHARKVTKFARLSDSRGLRLKNGGRFGGLFPEKLRGSLIELVAVAANSPHQFTGLFKRDVVLLREVVSVIGRVRCAPLSVASLFPLHHAESFRTLTRPGCQCESRRRLTHSNFATDTQIVPDRRNDLRKITEDGGNQ